MTLLEVTDAEHTEVAFIPADLAQNIGLFKDMIESKAIQGSDPIVLDERPEIFHQFVSWLFHRPDLNITNDNVEDLLEFAHKYEIPAMARDIGLHVATHQPMLSPERAYVLGACFGVTLLEGNYRKHVVEHCYQFCQLKEFDSYMNLLAKWCPWKLSSLVKDAITVQHGQMSTMNRLFEKFEKSISSGVPRSPVFGATYSSSEAENMKSKLREMSAALKVYKQQRADGKW